MNGEKVIDLLWEVKEGKKHPNKAYTELCVLFDVVGRGEQLFDFIQWDDCYIFDHLRSQSELNFVSMSGDYDFFIDPISVGPLGEYFDHWLGKLSKLRGYSKHRKFRGKL